ncbi:MAG: hypothetical protein WC405_03980 [Syntrophales bacterium]
MTIWKLIIIAWIITAGMLLDASAALSQPCCQWREQRPYGAYCEGSGSGSYGAKNPVKTDENVRTLLKQYFEGQDVSIGKITERDWYFAADIKDKKDNLVDRVIVDKRSGRIRSIY